MQVHLMGIGILDVAHNHLMPSLCELRITCTVSFEAPAADCVIGQVMKLSNGHNARGPHGRLLSVLQNIQVTQKVNQCLRAQKHCCVLASSQSSS